jgi:hypothetical protein
MFLNKAVEAEVENDECGQVGEDDLKKDTEEVQFDLHDNCIRWEKTT